MQAPIIICREVGSPQAARAGDQFSRSLWHRLSILLGFENTSLPADRCHDGGGSAWVARLSLTTAAGLMLVSLGHVAARHASDIAPVLYWVGITTIALPVCCRIAWPLTSRNERLALALLIGMAFYAVKVLQSPLYFAAFDEFLHWSTALSVMESGHLFDPNPLLPVSPFFPGLEVVTTAFANISGLSVFSSGLIVIGVGKAAFITALFLIAERASASSRVAGFACAVFIANSNYSTFHSAFAYESLAFVFLILALLAAIRLNSEEDSPKFFLLSGAAFAVAVTFTHHLTSYFCAAALTALAVLKMLEPKPSRQGAFALWLAVTSISADLIWSRFTGPVGSSYIAPIFEAGFDEFIRLFKSGGPSRTPFVSDDGARQPAWQMLIALTSLFIVLLGLATGFFRSFNVAGCRVILESGRLRVSWKDSGLVLLTSLAVAFPLSLLLRLTRMGWEIGNRLSSFASIGVCIVVAIAITGLWQGRSRSALRAFCIALVLTILILGGVVVGWAPFEVSHRYVVGGGAQSVEPLGIATAKWTREWLGPGQRFATDGVNRNLLAVFGRQVPITTLQGDADIAGVLFAKVLSPTELTAIKQSSTDYVLVDLRLAEALPRYGRYFEANEQPAIHAFPPEPQALLKFNGVQGVSRPFDSGATIIYDVRGLHALR